MSAMATRTVALSSKELDSAIEVLSSARHALQLTRFQKFSYFALTVTADVIMFLLAADIIVNILDESLHVNERSLSPFFALGVVVCVPIGLLSLALNYPLIHDAFLEKKGLNNSA